MDRSSKPASHLFQAHPWHGVSPGENAPKVVTVFIELVPSDTVKYELHKESGHLWLDRPQRFSSMCPTPYGFVPQTYCGEQVADYCKAATGLTEITGDGDPLDVCVLTDRNLSHGNLFLNARPIGGLRMIDRDEADDKIIAVLENDLSYGHFEDISEVPDAIVKRLMHYFLSYKQPPDKQQQSKQTKVEIPGAFSRDEAYEIIHRSLADYKSKFPELISVKG